MTTLHFLRLNEADNVVVLPLGGSRGDQAGGAALSADVPPGHKIACARIASGAALIKYGRPIGVAAARILPGDWVHEHNAAARPVTGAERLPVRPGGPRETRRASERRTFMGYRRQHGKPGVRNDLWIVPTVGCINGELRAAAARYHKPYWIDAVRVLEHPCGCSQLGDDLLYTRNILAGLARNPNASGVLLAGLGCEDLPAAEVLERIGLEDVIRRVKHVMLQDEGADTENLFARLDELAANTPRVREPFPLSDLRVGVLCGGNDGYSDLTAGPLAGLFADFLTAQGGAILAAEIPEMFGAEDAIAARIRGMDTFHRFMTMDRWFRDRYQEQADTTPSPADRERGVTTAEEKALGAIAKTGSAPVTAVLGYGEQATDDGGVQIAFAHRNDLVACTSLAGSGAQIILFTTGRGTPFGTVVPTIKISTTTPLARQHPSWIDFDAGTLIRGESWNDALNRLIDRVIGVAEGEKVSHEKKNSGEIAIFNP